MCGDTIKTIVLPFEVNINGAGPSATLSLPPIPTGVDEIEIQQIHVFSAVSVTNFYSLWTDLTGDNVCSIACDGIATRVECNIVIPIAPRPLPSTITFQVREYTGNSTFSATADELLLGVTLAFKKKCNH